MSTLLFLFWSSFVIGLSGAMMPGPVLTATVGEVMKRGAIAGPLIVLGHGLLEVAVLALLVTGLGDWLILPRARVAFGFAGGALLIVMGAHMALTARRAVEEVFARTDSAPTPLHGPVLAGIVTTLSNPYFYVWWATIGLGYASFSLEYGRVGLVAFYSGHILSDFAWYGLVALAVASGRRICPPHIYRAVLIACGFALLALGAMFIRYGWRVA